MRRVIDKDLNLRGPKRTLHSPWQVGPHTTLTAPPPVRADLPAETWLTTAIGKTCFQALYAMIRQECREVRLFQQSDHDIVILCRHGEQYLELTFPPDFPATSSRVAFALEIDDGGRLVQPAPLIAAEAAEQGFLERLDEIVQQFYPALSEQEENPL